MTKKITESDQEEHSKTNKIRLDWSSLIIVAIFLTLAVISIFRPGQGIG